MFLQGVPLQTWLLGWARWSRPRANVCDELGESGVPPGVAEGPPPGSSCHACSPESLSPQLEPYGQRELAGHLGSGRWKNSGLRWDLSFM